MNIPVNFELATLLKQYGFDVPCHNFYLHGKLQSDYILLQYKNEDYFLFAPTIADIMSWLYAKYHIWISVNKSEDFRWWEYNLMDVNNSTRYIGYEGHFDTYQLAYYAAIERVLNNYN